MSAKEEVSEPSSSAHIDLEKASDHAATASSFKRRKLRRFESFVPEDDDETVMEYLSEFNTRNCYWSWKHHGGEFKDSLLSAILKEESNEVDFDKQLFGEWKELFDSDDDFVFLKTWTKNGVVEKAIALTRQLTKVKVDLVRGKNIGVATDKSINDHAVVLLFPEGGEMKIKYCTSVVEIKMLDTSIRLLEDSEPPELKDSGAIVQSLSYISCFVWPSLVDMGVSPQKMRFTVIAGERKKKSGERKKKKKKDDDNARCIRGSYHAAKQCGLPFQYTIETFKSGTNDKSGTYTLFEYLRNVEEGFRLAMDHAVRTESLPRKPLGGLAIPGALAGCTQDSPTLIASPLYTDNLKAGQGDIWELRTNLSNLREIDDVVMVGNVDSDTEELNCLVKVSSDAAFGTWVSPDDCGKALRRLKDKNTSLGCLLCFLPLQTGIATVMRDLRAQNYACLRPKDAGVSLSRLWDGLHKLLNLTLLPAANAGQVHADIRAGHNITANILWRVVDGAVDMQLVDFDSFCQPALVPDNDPRSLNPMEDAISYLFLQVLSLGISWRDGITQQEVNGASLSYHSSRFGIGHHPLPAVAPMVMWRFFQSKFSNKTFAMTESESSAMDGWREDITGATQVTSIKNHYACIPDIYTSVGICAPTGG